jgi:hypothetical protein
MKNPTNVLLSTLIISTLCLGFSSCKTQDVEPTPGGLVINEVLYDPSNVGLAGDANGDGIYNQNQDECLEFVNSGGTALDISGFTISDYVIVDSSSTVRFTFPAGTILNGGKAFVVFGGGTPTGNFGGAQVFVSDNASGLSLGNTGERIVIKDAAGTVFYIFDSDALSDNPNESYARNPDITGIFVQHSTIVAGKTFSLGTTVNGSPF